MGSGSIACLDLELEEVETPVGRGRVLAGGLEVWYEMVRFSPIALVPCGLVAVFLRLVAEQIREICLEFGFGSRGAQIYGMRVSL